MARLPRFSPVEIPQHIIQRGNNRQPCFCEEQDFGVYAKFLKIAANNQKGQMNLILEEKAQDLKLYCS